MFRFVGVFPGLHDFLPVCVNWCGADLYPIIFPEHSAQGCDVFFGKTLCPLADDLEGMGEQDAVNRGGKLFSGIYTGMTAGDRTAANEAVAPVPFFNCFAESAVKGCTLVLLHIPDKHKLG